LALADDRCLKFGVIQAIYCTGSISLKSRNGGKRFCEPEIYLHLQLYEAPDAVDESSPSGAAVGDPHVTINNSGGFAVASHFRRCLMHTMQWLASTRTHDA
jgi:hypothetical protein